MFVTHGEGGDKNGELRVHVGLSSQRLRFRPVDANDLKHISLLSYNLSSHNVTTRIEHATVVIDEEIVIKALQTRNAAMWPEGLTQGVATGVCVIGIEEGFAVTNSFLEAWVPKGEYPLRVARVEFGAVSQIVMKLQDDVPVVVYRCLQPMSLGPDMAAVARMLGSATGVDVKVCMPEKSVGVFIFTEWTCWRLHSVGDKYVSMLIGDDARKAMPRIDATRLFAKMVNARSSGTNTFVRGMFCTAIGDGVVAVHGAWKQVDRVFDSYATYAEKSSDVPWCALWGAVNIGLPTEIFSKPDIGVDWLQVTSAGRGATGARGRTVEE
jgi:hypothetical protein